MLNIENLKKENWTSAKNFERHFLVKHFKRQKSIIENYNGKKSTTALWQKKI